MPIGLDPDCTVDVWLFGDEAKPLESRPTFQFRFLTAKQFRRVVETAEKADSSNEPLEIRKLRHDALLIGLAGWRNLRTSNADVIAEFFPIDPPAGEVDLPFKPDLLDAVLTVAEQWELLGEYPKKVTLTEREKNLLRFSSPIDSGESAGNAAAAGSADAQQLQASPSQSA